MKKARLVIDGNIGEPDPLMEAFGVEDNAVSSQSVQKFLEDNKEATVIEVEIRSNGGSVSHGFDIYDQLVNSKKKIITKGYRVNSIATVIFLAGSERYLSKNAEFIVHNPWFHPSALGDIILTADKADEIAADLRATEDKMFNFYAEKLGLDDSGKVKLREMMDTDSDIGSAEAIKFGFASGYLEQASKKAAFTDLILATYKQKSNKKTKMSKQVEERLSGLEKMIAKVLALVPKKKAEVKADSTPLEGGEKIWHEGELKVGTACFEDEAMTVPCSKDSYTDEDGNVITLADGVVTAIEVVEPNAELEELKKQLAETTKKLEVAEAEKTEAVKATTEVAEEMKKVSTELASVKKIVLGSKKEHKAEKITDDMPAWKKKLINKRNNRIEENGL